MSVAAAETAAALSPEQLLSGLWADVRLRVYGMVLGSRVAGLPDRLAQADSLDYHCLVPGALSPAQRVRAPYLVELRPDSSFSRWLLLEAAAGFTDWGVVARSSARMLDVRSHARDLRSAVSPEGRIFRLDWMDPVVLDIPAELGHARPAAGHLRPAGLADGDHAAALARVPPRSGPAAAAQRRRAEGGLTCRCC